jgi:hypothetical protein
MTRYLGPGAAAGGERIVVPQPKVLIGASVTIPTNAHGTRRTAHGAAVRLAARREATGTEARAIPMLVDDGAVEPVLLLDLAVVEVLGRLGQLRGHRVPRPLDLRRPAHPLWSSVQSLRQPCTFTARPHTPHTTPYHTTHMTHAHTRHTHTHDTHTQRTGGGW